MIIFGTRGKIYTLLSLGKRKCEHCHNEAEFYLTISFRYFHIFWIPMFITIKNYYVICEICNYGVEMDKRKIEENFENSPIPWIYRFGWIIPVSLILFFMILSI